MTLKKLFHFIHYSHLPLVIMAMVLTGTISAVLHQTVAWRVVLLTGSATFLIYSIDNLLDWENERFRYLQISKIVRAYHRLTYLLMPLATGLIFLLIYNRSNQFKVVIFLLGIAAAMATTHLPKYRPFSLLIKDRHHHFLVNRIFVSAVWTAVVVFLPGFYGDEGISPRTWRVFFYTYNLIFIYSTLWRLEKVDWELREQLIASKLFPALILLAMLSMVSVIHEVLSGLTPTHNLVNLLPPVVSAITLLTIIREKDLTWQKISLFTLSLLILSSFSAFIHLILG